ncbi:MAG: hypothetical protein QOK40_481 [Miltoncostaeaceae bacterium]|nr:hypothetical protein [Miltoncostaeaceae bacterium]
MVEQGRRARSTLAKGGPRQQYPPMRLAPPPPVVALVLAACLSAPAGAAAVGDPAGLALARKVIRAYAGVPGVEVRGGGAIEGVPAEVVLRYSLRRGRIAVAVTTQTFRRDSPLPDGRIVRAGTAWVITDYLRRELLTRPQRGTCWNRAPLDPRGFPPPLPLLPLDADYAAPRREGRSIVLRQTTGDGAVDLVIDRSSLRVASQRGVAGSFALTNARWRTLKAAPGRPSGRPACKGG